MAYQNTSQTYGSVAKFFHWTISFLVIVLLIGGFFMGDLPNSPLKGQVYSIHKLTGLFILTLVVLRLLWKMSNLQPQLPSNLSCWQVFVSKAVHGLFYLVLILMPLSGLVMSTAAGRPPVLFGYALALPGIPESEAIVNQASQMHTLFMWFIIGLLFLHVGAALKHHFIYKNNILKRMLPGK